ncbi:sigma-70 family RNA polymerase sigma factor [Phocaeicola paurosaccharolyticus]|uniref:RNA polymerase sigma factor n=1 Tax=Phocaeicola paurosaccharolyticus TaxID=732242 RepID=UPI002FE23EB0
MNIQEFTTEVECLRPVLIKVAQRYISNSDVAEDMVQDTFLKLWQMNDELKPPMTSLAKAIVHNLCMDYHRHNNSLNIVQEDSIGDIEYESDDNERIEKLIKAVNSLPGLQQNILRLRHMDGMSMEEIAKLIGSNEVAVRKALSRARMAVMKEYVKVD